jgi:hypothetical protein
MIELFHATNDDGASAAARRFVTEHALEDQLRFRNVHYPEVLADLQARGGKLTPALWDGVTLVEGEAAVLAALAALI